METLFREVVLTEGETLGMRMTDNPDIIMKETGCKPPGVGFYVLSVDADSLPAQSGVKIGDKLDSLASADGVEINFTPDNTDIRVFFDTLQNAARPLKLVFRACEDTPNSPVFEVMEGFRQVNLGEGEVLGLRLTNSADIITDETGFVTGEYGVYVLSVQAKSISEQRGVKVGDKLEALFSRNGSAYEFTPDNSDVRLFLDAIQNAERPLRLLFRSCDWATKIVMEGPLEKKNQSSKIGLSYSKRYFELTARNMSYYDKKDGVLKGCIPVATITGCNKDSGKKSGYHFTVEEPERGYKMRAETEEIQGQWVSAVIGELDKRRRVQESIRRTAEMQRNAYLSAEQAKGKSPAELEELARKQAENESNRVAEQNRRARAKNAAAPLMSKDVIWWENKQIVRKKGGMDDVFVRARIDTGDVGGKAFFQREYQRWRILDPVEIIEVLEDGSDGRKLTTSPNDFLYRSAIDGDALKQINGELSNLSPLNEATILASLHERYDAKEIYSYIGPTLVAVNAFCDSFGIDAYSSETMLKYINEQRCRLKLPPHVFAVGREVYFRLVATGTPQAVIITGESGAGKSFSARKILQFFSEVSGVNAAASPVSSSIQITNPILEAFGYAKMPRNDDSSRFGKLFKLFFDEGGSIVGGRIETYLLEKSRVVGHGIGERSFHIFYQLLAYLKQENPPWAGELMLPSLDSSHYKYLASTVNDDEAAIAKSAAKFQEVVDALLYSGFAEAEQVYLWRTLAAIMKLGNVEFSEDEKTKAKIDDMTEVAGCAKIFGMSESMLAEALCSREFPNPMAGKPPILFKVGVDMAKQNRDALAKSVYSGIFDLLVDQINEVFEDNKLEGFDADLPLEEQRVISVLDIFGFEVLDSNSLEQLLINVANEQLHDYFGQHMYAEQVALLEKESPAGGPVAAEGEDPEGLTFFHAHLTEICREQNERMNELRNGVLGNALVETCKKPFGTDEQFMTALAPIIDSSKIITRENETFEISHFAEKVIYTSAGFVDKNKFRLYDNLQKAIEQSENGFLRRLVASDGEDQTKQISERFMASLDSLLGLLNASMPRFIRCLKSNTHKKAWVFEQPLVHEQLMYASILQTVRICTTGFPEQVSFRRFYLQCRPIFIETPELMAFEDGYPDYFRTQRPLDEVPGEVWKEGCSVLLELCVERLGQQTAKSIRIGSESVLLREEASQALDKERLRVDRLRVDERNAARRIEAARLKAEQASKPKDGRRGKDMKEKLCLVM